MAPTTAGQPPSMMRMRGISPEQRQREIQVQANEFASAQRATEQRAAQKQRAAAEAASKRAVEQRSGGYIESKKDTAKRLAVEKRRANEKRNKLQRAANLEIRKAPKVDPKQPQKVQRAVDPKVAASGSSKVGLISASKQAAAKKKKEAKKISDQMKRFHATGRWVGGL